MDALTAEGYHVLGGYMSPVNDLYHKKDLAPAEHHIRMCEFPVAESPLVVVDSWEILLFQWFGDGVAEKVRVMLLCGTDLLESIVTPGVWKPDQARTLLQEYGIVCINRDGKDARCLVFEHEILYNIRVSTLETDFGGG